MLRQKNPVEKPSGKPRVGSMPPKLPWWYDSPWLTEGTDVPHPDVADRTSKGMGTREITLTTPKGKVTAAYGRQRLAGKVQYTFKSGRDLFIVKELCLGECDSLVAIDAGGGEITTPFVFNANFQFWFYPGTPAGQVDPNLAAVDGTWNEAFQGVCYVVEKYSNVGTYWSELLNTIYYVKARKCLDSSNPTGPRIYSENVWDQWFDFVLWSEGKALPLSRVNAASFAAAKAADIAASRSMDCHMLLMEPQNPDDVINTFRLIASAWWFPDANQFLVVADRPASPVVTYTNRHLVDQNAPRLNRDDVVDRPNRVVGYFTDVTNKWQRTKVPGAAVETAAVTSGLEEPIEVEYEFPWIHDAAVARSRLVYILNSHQFDGKLSVPWMAATADRQLGDLVTQDVAARGLVFTGRLLRRMKDIATNTFAVVLHEYNAAKFNYDPVSNPAKTPSTLPDPAEAPSEVTGFNTASIIEELYQEQPGFFKSRARLTGTLPNFQWLDAVEIHLSINGGAYRFLEEFSGAPGAAFDVVVPTVMEIGIVYGFKLIVRSQFQQRSTGVIATKTFLGKTTPPSDCRYLTGAQKNGRIELKWQPGNDRDYKGFSVRRGAIGDTFALAPVEVFSGDATECFDEPPVGDHAYFVKAFDAASQFSTNAKEWRIRNFFIGPQPITEVTEAFIFNDQAGGIVETFGDVALCRPRYRNGAGALLYNIATAPFHIICEGITTRKTLTFMLARGGATGGNPGNSPTVADGEISTNGYASIQQWEDLLDAPRRKGQGIWAPLNAGSPETVDGAFFSTHFFGGDANGMRNSKMTARMPGGARVGADAPNLNTWAKPVTEISIAPYSRNLLYGQVYSEDDILSAENIDWDESGAYCHFGVRIFTNSFVAQTIVRSDPAAFLFYKFEQKIPALTTAPVDLVTSGGSAQASFTLPKAMKSGQVPYISTEVISAHNAIARLVTVSNSAFTIETINAATGAALAGVTVRCRIVDAGAGGTAFDFTDREF